MGKVREMKIGQEDEENEDQLREEEGRKTNSLGF